jgi:hypothetical protein
MLPPTPPRFQQFHLLQPFHEFHLRTRPATHTSTIPAVPPAPAIPRIPATNTPCHPHLHDSSSSTCSSHSTNSIYEHMLPPTPPRFQQFHLLQPFRALQIHLPLPPTTPQSRQFHLLQPFQALQPPAALATPGGIPVGFHAAAHPNPKQYCPHRPKPCMARMSTPQP